MQGILSRSEFLRKSICISFASKGPAGTSLSQTKSSRSIAGASSSYSLATVTMSIQNLLSLLERAAQDPSGKGIVVYLNSSKADSLFLTYKSLLGLVEQRSIQLQKMESVDSMVVLMYFTDHLDSIIWFWAIVVAGGIPCICPPLTRDFDQRQRNIAHLQELLGNPPVITSSHLASEFLGLTGLRIVIAGMYRQC